MIRIEKVNHHLANALSMGFIKLTYPIVGIFFSIYQ